MRGDVPQVRYREYKIRESWNSCRQDQEIKADAKMHRSRSQESYDPVAQRAERVQRAQDNQH